MNYFDLKSKADFYLKEWDNEKETCPSSEIPLLIALTFEPTYIDKAIQMSIYWLEKCLSKKNIDFRNYGTFTFILNFSSTLHLFNSSQIDVFKDIYKSSPPSDADSNASYRLLRYYLNCNYPSCSTKKIPNISFENLPTIIGNVNIECLYSFILNSNTPRWHDCIQPYFQLISLLHFQYNNVLEKKTIIEKLKVDFLRKLL